MKKIFIVVAVCFSSVAGAPGVILLDTGDPSANTTAPTSPLAGSGWQYEGEWGGLLGTPIAPNFFISAAHIGRAGMVFSFQGNEYRPVGVFSSPGSDFLIWKVAETFSTFAPLYTAADEVGGHIVVIGRGTQRGSERILDNTLRGWNWGDSDSVQRWGENDIEGVVPYQGHDLLYANFDQHSVEGDRPNECHLSVGDSGGAAFLDDDGTWKLVGTNSFVDAVYSAADENTLFQAALFDARGYYTKDSNNMFVQIADANPVPTSFYLSRISSELSWIASVIADPQVGRENNNLTLTYWRLTAPSTDIVYEIVQSTDLVSWYTAAPQEEILSTTGDLEQVKAKVDPGDADHLFVRLKTTRP